MFWLLSAVWPYKSKGRKEWKTSVDVDSVKRKSTFWLHVSSDIWSKANPSCYTLLFPPKVQAEEVGLWLGCLKCWLGAQSGSNSGQSAAWSSALKGNFISSETVAAAKQNRAFGEVKRTEDVQVCACKKSGEGSGEQKGRWQSSAGIHRIGKLPLNHVWGKHHCSTLCRWLRKVARTRIQIVDLKSEHLHIQRKESLKWSSSV